MVSHCSALVVNKDIRDVLIVDDTASFSSRSSFTHADMIFTTLLAPPTRYPSRRNWIFPIWIPDHFSPPLGILVYSFPSLARNWYGRPSKGHHSDRQSRESDRRRQLGKTLRFRRRKSRSQLGIQYRD